MRPRFSLRLILLAFALLGLALYVFVVRPTALAQRFVAAVEERDYDAAQRLMVDGGDWGRVVRPPQSFKADRIYAELMPREWQDVWRVRRRIILRISRHNDRNGNYIDWTEDNDLVARPLGLELVMPDNMNLNWPAVLRDVQPAIINPGEGVRLEPNSRTG